MFNPESVYPSFLDNMHETSFFKDRAILTPKNLIIDEINDYMMSLIPGEEKIYLSCDSPLNKPSMSSRPDDIHTSEFLNTVNVSGIPNHILRLKVGVPVMLM
jgi:ATP-dependent DNA helicase PIF1